MPQSNPDMQDHYVAGVRGVLMGRSVPAPALLVVGGLSMYLGAAAAVWLFAEVSPAAVTWLRQLGAAAVLLAWRRPGRDAWRGRAFWLAAAFGLVTAAMNLAFYESIARLPLGTAVALEFAGPVALAAIGSRSRRDVTALVLATGGVVLIADVRWAGSPLGVMFALTAAALWAGYILLGKRVAAGVGVDGLAVGFAVATVALSPLAPQTGPVWDSPRLLVLGIAVGVLATAVPYALDQVVLRRGVSRETFAVLQALLPVTATLTGLVLLAQVPTLPEALGILAVVAGVAMRSREPRAEPI